MNRLGLQQRRLLGGVGGALFLTGAAWAALRYFPSIAGLDARGARAWTAVLMQVHGAAAMLALVLLGSLFSRHVAHGWRLSRNRGSGGGILGLAAVLGVTGYLLYYAGDEQARQFASWLHLAAGLAVPAPIALHTWKLLHSWLKARRLVDRIQ